MLVYQFHHPNDLPIDTNRCDIRSQTTTIRGLCRGIGFPWKPLFLPTSRTDEWTYAQPFGCDPIAFPGQVPSSSVIGVTLDDAVQAAASSTLVAGKQHYARVGAMLRRLTGEVRR